MSVGFNSILTPAPIPPIPPIPPILIFFLPFLPFLPGNWQEELALQTTTGYSRVAPNLTPAYFKNHDRVIHHTDNLPPSQYESTAHAAMSQEKGYRPDMVGAREKRRMDKFNTIARGEAEEKQRKEKEVKNKINYETNTQASQSKMPSDLARLSNPQTSTKLYGGAKTKGALERADVPNLPPGVYSDATAVTYWTSQLTNSDKITDFPITAGNSSNPFTRSSAFTNDIRDGRLRHAEGADGGGVEPAGLGRDRNGISEQLTEDFHGGSNFPTW